MSKQPIFLRVVKDGQPVEMKQFTQEQIVIGREGEVALALHDPQTALIHAMVEERGGKYYLCDLGTEHGTFYNGKKIIEVELKSGESFKIGNTTIEFHVGIPKSHASTQTHVAPTAPKVTPQPKTTVPIAPPPKPKAPAVKTPVQNKFSGAPSVGGMTSSQSIQKNEVRKGTFAPPSSSKIKTFLKPEQGSSVEVVVFWKDRVLTAHHFGKNKVVKVGSHPDNDIILPVFGAVRLKHPILKIENTAKIILTADMDGEVVKRDGTKTTINDLKRSGSLRSVGSHYVYELRQNELVTIHFGEGVELIIRYVSAAGHIKLAPYIDMTANQLTGLVISLLAMFLFLFYVFLYAPPSPEKVEEETIPPRKAQFFYKRPVEEIKPIEVSAAPKSAQETIKDKEVAPARGEEGAAQEAKPNKYQSKKQILTADKPGKDKGIKKGGTQGGGTNKNKDVSKSGVLGVFATKGIQEQLSKAYQGSGNVAGASAGATGSGGESAGAGITTGGGLKDVGMGGQGTATVGIAGPKTKGRGGGIQGYGTGPLGAKKNATILAGGDDMTATGGIDKEAIRRVVLQNLKQVKACYDKGLNKDPGLYGKITIQWSIGGGGRVLDAGVKNSTMNSSEVENCIVNRLRTWKFPEPPVNEIAVVSYPFVFQAQE